MIRLIVGLGNPGSKYAKTRHNAGVWFINAICQKYKIDLSIKTSFYGSFGEFVVEDNRYFILIPSTFMNHSGQSVSAFTQYYKINPSEVLVVHDELDLLPGTARFKQSGSSGGHNGLKDIIARYKTYQFWRLRIGIGHPGHRSKVNEYVMHAPCMLEFEKINQVILKTINIFPTFVRGGMQEAMQQLHTI